nr:MAG TPA_asm: hypothetical protein [Caudoviricetes sp.]
MISISSGINGKENRFTFIIFTSCNDFITLLYHRGM